MIHIVFVKLAFETNKCGAARAAGRGVLLVDEQLYY